MRLSRPTPPRRAARLTAAPAPPATVTPATVTSEPWTAARYTAARLTAGILVAASLSGCASFGSRSAEPQAAAFLAGQHRVERGDTVFALARRYGVSKEAIRDLNRLDRTYRIHVGQRLLIPGRAAPQVAALSGARPAPAQRASWTPPSAPAPQRAWAQPQNRRELSDPAVSQRASGAAASFSPRRLLRPVEGPIIRPYGALAGGRRNAGVDIAAAPGAPVMAAADGEIAFVSDPTGPVGAVILMQHPAGMTTIYGRLVDIEVRVGQRVGRGQPLARVAPRRGDQAALHFELRRGSEPVNPTPFL